jgi:hemerythrin-like metal-binding protein
MIEWNDKYSVGISIIDEEHKKLIDITNTAIVAKKQNYNSEKTKEVLNGMVDYTYKQFTIEDTGMVKFNYSEYQLHRNELLNFMDGTIERYKDLAMDNYYLINETLEFLKKWFVNHIQETDKKYINSINESGLCNADLIKDKHIFQFKPCPYQT